MNMLTRSVSAVAAGVVVLLASPAAPQSTPSAQPAAMAARLAQPGNSQRRPQRGAPPFEARATGPVHEDSVTFTVPLGDKGAFELSTVAIGDVVVTGVGGNTVRIAATKRVRHRDAAVARELLERVNITIAERGGFVEALTELPQRNNIPVFIDFTISVPRDTEVSLRTRGGTLRVSNLEGELRADAIAGDVMLSSLNRINAKALSGSLTISDSDGEEVSAETLGGTLQVRNVKARTIELSSVSGPVLVADVQCDRCQLTSVSGDLEMSGRLTPGGRYELFSNSGDIRLVPTGDTGFNVEARTMPGRFRSDFPIREDSSSSRANNRGVVFGTYGDGGAIISMRTFLGDVSIVKR